MSETEIKGILGTKLGMTQVFDEDNRVVPVTVVEAGPCVVTQIRTVETDGYTAIQIAYGDIDPRKVNKPAAGHFNKAGVTPRRHVAEIRMDDVSGYEVGQEVTAAIFEGITFVDVTGTSKGKGFAGGMKRHGFAGQGASHGNQAAHRRVGGIGVCTTPAQAEVAERDALCARIDAAVAAIYAAFTRFEAEYNLREAQARAYQAAGYAGEVPVQVAAFAGPAGKSAQEAAEIIIREADKLHEALSRLGALRMRKYEVKGASGIEAARAAAEEVLTAIAAIGAALR